MKAKLCHTATGLLIYENQVLLIKHKKLSIWLAPGGHIDSNELPHQAAEREVWEETGVKVKALSYGVLAPPKTDSEFKPLPMAVNFHWVCKENYQQRQKNKDKQKRAATKLWPKGCEQHLNSMYLVEPVAGVDFKQNKEETDGIAWFGLDELTDLETADDIRVEIKEGFRLVAKIQTSDSC